MASILEYEENSCKPILFSTIIECMNQPIKFPTLFQSVFQWIIMELTRAFNMCTPLENSIQVLYNIYLYICSFLIMNANLTSYILLVRVPWGEVRTPKSQSHLPPFAFLLVLLLPKSRLPTPIRCGEFMEREYFGRLYFWLAPSMAVLKVG